MKYWCIFVLYVISLAEAKSQIIYHDLNPDIGFPTGSASLNFSYSLDIDGDGTSDYLIKQSQSSPTQMDYSISTYNGNKFIGVGLYGDVDTLQYGDSISTNSNFNPYSLGFLAWKVYAPPYNSGGLWNNKENRFIGVCFNTPTGLKYGWIRLFNVIKIADYAYNSTANQPILAGEGLPYTASNIRITDIDNFNNGRDIKIQFYKPFNEPEVLEYKVVIVPSSNGGTFTIDSAKAVLNSNSFSVPVINKNIDTVMNAAAKDVYGNLIISQIAYKAFIVSLPNLITSFDTLMSEASNDLTLNRTNFKAGQLTVISTKVPAGSYNLNVDFNAAPSETGILNYRLFFIQEKDSISFTVDSANLVLPVNYITINKTGTAQNLNYQSNLVKTRKGDVLKPFEKYQTVLMSVADTVNTNVSSLCHPSNPFTVYTQVQSVSEIIVTDVADNHDLSDIKVFFKKVPDESNISGYRGLIIPETSLGSFNLDSANASTNYIGFTKNGQDQSLQLPSSLKDVNGNMVQESQTYYVKVLTITDNHFSDANALSSGSKYFGFNTPDYFYAGCRDLTKAVYHDIQDTGIYSYHLSGSGPVVSYTLDIDANGIADLKFECADVGGLGSWTEYANVVPLNGTEFNFKTLSSDFLIRNDSADMIYDDMNWNDSIGRLRLDDMHPSGNPSPNNFTYTIQGEWEYGMPKFIAVRLIGADTLYAWVRISLQRHPLSTNRSIGIMIYDYAYQKNSEQIGIKEAKEATDISLYPNPAADYALIQCEDFKSGLYKTELLNMAGQVVFSDKIVDDHYKLNTSQLAKGIYAVRVIKDDRSVKIMKLIVQ